MPSAILHHVILNFQRYKQTVVRTIFPSFVIFHILPKFNTTNAEIILVSFNSNFIQILNEIYE